MASKGTKRIPTPHVATADLSIFSANQSEDWQQPSTYIRFRELDADEVINYDADSIDRRWLEAYNAEVPRAHQISLDLLEAVIDHFEKMRGFNQNVLPPCPTAGQEPRLLLPTLPTMQQLVELYWWWRKRLYCRVKRVYPLGKPLIPQFEVRPDPSDIQQPFHHRDIEKHQNYLRNVPRIKLANTNNAATCMDLHRQKDALEQALEILRLIKRREQLKKEYFRVQFRIWGLRKRTSAPLDRGLTTFDAHVRRMYGATDPLARSLASIKDVAQLLERCRAFDYPIHRFKVRLRPSPAAAPPHVPCDVTPCFGRSGQIIWPLKARLDAKPAAARIFDEGFGPQSLHLPGITAAVDSAMSETAATNENHCLTSMTPCSTDFEATCANGPSNGGNFLNFTPCPALLDDLDNMDWDWDLETEAPARKRPLLNSQYQERLVQLEAPPFVAG